MIAQLASLAKDTRFELLGQVYEQRRRELEAYVGRQQLQFGPPVDQRRADFRAGFWSGIQAVLRSPGSADKALEAALNDPERTKQLVPD